MQKKKPKTSKETHKSDEMENVIKGRKPQTKKMSNNNNYLIDAS